MFPFRSAPWLRGPALCLVPALAAHVVAGALDLHQRLAGWTGPAAWLRPDALPFSLLVLALAAAALALRRQVSLGRELAARDAAERRGGHLAHHDELTRLPDRTLLCDRLQQCLHMAQRAGSRVGLLVLDLARFRDVNDAFGHAAGDLLLVQVAERLRGCARASDTVARIGGDQFAVVLPQLGHPADAAPVAERMMCELARPFDLNGREARIEASVGITVFPDDGATPEELFRNVDFALHEAKEEGARPNEGGAPAAADGYRFFLPDMRALVEARRALEAQLRSAVAGGEFALHYQPVVGIADGRGGHVEALLRWNHPERGLLAPREFLAAAAAIVRSIINLGHSLDRRVVAEGVETEEQLDFLRVQGCDEAQGFHLAKPQPASSLTRLFQREPAKRRATTAAR